MEQGYLYILINPSMPGIAKVGKTTRDPSSRVAELSAATGVASPFLLAFQQPVADCSAAERWVHTELTRTGHRVAENREFFSAPLHEIVAIVARAATITGTEADPRTQTQLDLEAPELADELIATGDDLESGNGVLVNHRKALDYYEQAAKLGSAEACSRAAVLYQYGGTNVRPDLEKAVAYYRQAVSLGWWNCLGSLALVFLQGNQPNTAVECWRKLFETALELKRRGDSRVDVLIGRAGAMYPYAVACGNVKEIFPKELIEPFAETMIASLEEDAANEAATLPWHLKGKNKLAIRVIREDILGGPIQMTSVG